MIIEAKDLQVGDRIGQATVIKTEELEHYIKVTHDAYFEDYYYHYSDELAIHREPKQEKAIVSGDKVIIVKAKDLQVGDRIEQVTVIGVSPDPPRSIQVIGRYQKHFSLYSLGSDDKVEIHRPPMIKKREPVEFVPTCIGGLHRW